MPVDRNGNRLRQMPTWIVSYSYMDNRGITSSSQCQVQAPSSNEAIERARQLALSRGRRWICNNNARPLNY